MKYFLLIFALLLPFGFSLAQTNMNLSANELSIELKSSDLKPFSKVKATVNDYVYTVSTQAITWKIDGKTKPEFDNQRTVEVQLNDLGKPTKLQVFIKTQEGFTVSAEKNIDPIYLDIIVEPQTRTPSFYKGRALPSIDSTINLTALINGGIENSEKYIYNWDLNGVNLQSGGAIGKYKLSTTIPMGQIGLLTLNISKVTGEIIARKTLEILPVEPEIAFYEVNSLFGISHLKINQTLNLIGNSTIVRAEPYYLDIKTYNQPQFTEWKIDGNRSPNSGNPYEVTLARQGGSGKANVGFHVRNLETLLQGAESSFRVNY